MNALAINIAESVDAADLAWQHTPGAAAIIKILLDASAAHQSFGQSITTEPEIVAAGVLGSVSITRERTEGSFSTYVRVRANGGIAGELWATLEQLRADYLAAQCGRTLYTAAQCSRYAALCEVATTVEDAVIDALRERGA